MCQRFFLHYPFTTQLLSLKATDINIRIHFYRFLHLFLRLFTLSPPFRRPIHLDKFHKSRRFSFGDKRIESPWRFELRRVLGIPRRSTYRPSAQPPSLVYFRLNAPALSFFGQESATQIHSMLDDPMDTAEHFRGL